MRPLEALIALLITLAMIAILSSAHPSPPINDGTDTGVGCLDECLEPLDTTADAEPIRADQEEEEQK